MVDGGSDASECSSNSEEKGGQSRYRRRDRDENAGEDFQRRRAREEAVGT